MPTFPRILRSLALSSALGTALGLVLNGFRLIPDIRASIFISLAFSVPMWSGFDLLVPWFMARPMDQESPFRVALGSLGRILGLYTGLLVLSVSLVRLGTGLNLLARPTVAILTFMIGLTITAIMMGLQTTQHMVMAERARAKAEVESLRLQLLEADHARKTLELEEARQLQLSMLPKAPPECCGMAFAYGLWTATEVGGDTYDHRTFEDESILISFGDATGHGLQAGLLVTAVKALFHTVPAGLSLPEALLYISNGVRSLQMPRMAMALTLLRREGDLLRFAAAGMPSLLHFKAAENRIEFHRTLGPPLGQLKHFAYTEGRLAFEPGDAVLLCSDGFPECLDPEDRMLGYDQMAPAFLRHAQRPAEELIQALYKETEAWAKGRPLADDLSFLVMRRE
jgi:serine phosphatase RsbU (regulator of sigma subunit)